MFLFQYKCSVRPHHRFCPIWAETISSDEQSRDMHLHNCFESSHQHWPLVFYVSCNSYPLSSSVVIHFELLSLTSIRHISYSLGAKSLTCWKTPRFDVPNAFDHTSFRLHCPARRSCIQNPNEASQRRKSDHDTIILALTSFTRCSFRHHQTYDRDVYCIIFYITVPHVLSSSAQTILFAKCPHDTLASPVYEPHKFLAIYHRVKQSPPWLHDP